MKSFFLVAAVMAVAVNFVEGTAEFEDEDIVDWYDCSDKIANKAYRHPYNCNMYIKCSEEGIGRQYYCPPCYPTGFLPCPEPWLRWYDPVNTCVWAETAECIVDPITTTPSPDPPKEGDPCHPELCKLVGDCLHYLHCDKETNSWKQEKCDEALVWVPNDLDGGRCGDFEELDEATKEKYWKDKDCLACGWWAEECSSTYYYQEPHQSGPNNHTMHCYKGQVWDHETVSCRLCRNVKDKTGQPCCG